MNKANFYVNGTDTIAELKDRFSHLFPGLDINFFTNYEEKQSNNSCAMFSLEVSVRDMNQQFLEGFIELNDLMTADEIEQLIHDHFHLHAQISLRSLCLPHNATHKTHRLLYGNDNPEIRMPERSNMVSFKYIPFGC